MSDGALFDLADFAPPAPAWAVTCFYCTPDAQGYYDRANHDHAHRQLTCAVCHESEPNRLLFEMSHGICLGGCYQRDALVCTSLDLQLNHLSYDITHGQAPAVRDLPALELGWRFGPDGTAIAPAGWPSGAEERRRGPLELHASP